MTGGVPVGLVGEAGVAQAFPQAQAQQQVLPQDTRPAPQTREEELQNIIDDMLTKQEQDIRTTGLEAGRRGRLRGFTAGLEADIRAQAAEEVAPFQRELASRREEAARLAGLAGSGGGGGIEGADGEAETAQSSVDLIDSLFENKKGLRKAVGGSLRKFFKGEKPFAGTKAADFVAQVNQLKSQLAVGQLEKLRGLGSMSQGEFDTVSNAVQALELSMTDAAFKRELKRIQKEMRKVVQRMQSGETTGETGAVASATDDTFIPDNPALASQWPLMSPEERQQLIDEGLVQ
jgi:hypothetical protein